VTAWGVAASLAWLAFTYYVVDGRANDTHAYWLAASADHPYQRPPGMNDAFLYSPIFAQVLHLFDGVSWPVFMWGWRLIEGVAFAWLVAPLKMKWAVPLWLMCVPEILLGNIVGLLCVSVVLGLRRPSLWSFPLLTKVSPGLLGLLFFGARREWTAILKAGAVTLILAGASWLVAPQLWREWFTFLTDQPVDSSTQIRSAFAAVLVVFAAMTKRAWLFAPALMISTPVLVSIEVVAYLAAIPRLLAHDAEAVETGPGDDDVRGVGAAASAVRRTPHHAATPPPPR
jgi:hypothetical protein